MPFIFTSKGQQTLWATQSNMIPTAITGLTATSTVAGQITLTWSGGLGNNVKYTYALSNNTNPIATIGAITGNGVGTPYSVTLTLTTTNSVTTTVTLTASVLGGSTSAISSSITNVIYTNSGVAISGFAYGNGGANSAILTTGGNPGGCIQDGPQNYYYGTLGFSFLNTTIVFDAYGAGTNVSILNMFFGCNSSGAGQMLRIDFRNGTYSSGFASTTSWTAWSAPTGTIYNASTTWYTIKMQITSAGVATWYCNGVLQSGTGQSITMTNNGNYMAFSGDYSGTVYDLVDNFTVYSGIV